MPIDLILRGGRVIDPSQKLDAVMDVAFADGKVVWSEASSRPIPGQMCATCPATLSRLA